jgi:hypothetical protein
MDYTNSSHHESSEAEIMDFTNSYVPKNIEPPKEIHKVLGIAPANKLLYPPHIKQNENPLLTKSQ